jgi:20S proteasome subunit beta 7
MSRASVNRNSSRLENVSSRVRTPGSYGSTKRYKNLQRVRAVNSTTVIGFTGELSDFDYIMTLLEELNTADFCEDDGKELSPREIYAYLTRVMYNRRNKFDPLWNSLVVAGTKNGESFLGTVGMIGQHYADSHVAAGFGNHMARPLFREKHTDDMSEAEARTLMEDALRACVMRDKSMMNKFQIAKVEKGKAPEISEPFAVATSWDYEKYRNPSQFAPGTW